MLSLMSASHMASACASVLQAMNSTPRRPASTIRLTAFEPPPPTPTTLMTARYEVSIVGPAPSPRREFDPGNYELRHRVRGFLPCASLDPQVSLESCHGVSLVSR